MAEIAPIKEKPEFLDKELEEMFQAGVHFAFSRSRRHPRMSPFIYGIKSNVEIFDLSKVRDSLKKAEAFLQKLGEGGKTIFWVGTKPSVREIIREIGRESGHPYVADRWLGGTLTNAKIIRERLKYFEDLKREKALGELEKYTKREQLQISREIATLERYLAGLEGLKNEPEAMVIVDPGEEITAFREALKVKMPIVAILSSDNDPADITYPIPANDTASSAVGYILKRLFRAFEEGKGKAKGEGSE